MYYKRYEYLEDSYYEDANKTLSRRDFLSKIDNFISQKKYVRITLLNWSEEPLKEIQGIITSGNIALDGSSAVRRTLSLTTVVDSESYDIDDAQMDFAINKKIFVEVGIVNKTDEYPQYPILWFPQGLFFIKTFTCSSSTSSGVNITLSCEDKMAMLNGDVGGTFPAAIILDEEDTQTTEGKIVSEKVLVYRIIQELVNHYGSEDLNNIVIEDVPLRVKRIVKWNGSTPLYLKKEGETGVATSYTPSLEANGGTKYSSGDDIGYIWDDYVWESELTANAGDTVQSVLETIKSALGNYEYFYDVFGVFHFREIKNYLNTTQATTLLNDMDEHSYFIDTATPKEQYTFSSNNNIISLNSSPQYDKIKNDFIIQGLRKSTNSSVSYPIRYHLAIDTKPSFEYKVVEGVTRKVYGTWPTWAVSGDKPGVLIYAELDTDIHKACFPRIVDGDSIYALAYGDFNEIYLVIGQNEDGETTYNAYTWTSESVWKAVEVIKYFTSYQTLDWRTELYMRGLVARYNHSIDEGYYFSELESAWPQIYDLAEQKFFGEESSDTLDIARALCDGDYYLDFIDAPSSQMGEFAISAIGRRSDVVVDEDVNCLFEPEIPDVCFIDTTDKEDDEIAKEREECINNQISYCQLNSDMYSAILAGGSNNAAWDQITLELYSHTYYQRTVSITAFPVYYLEPNVRIRIDDTVTNTHGDFIIQNISLPLDAGQSMSVTANECMVKR